MVEGPKSCHFRTQAPRRLILYFIFTELKIVSSLQLRENTADEEKDLNLEWVGGEKCTFPIGTKNPQPPTLLFIKFSIFKSSSKRSWPLRCHLNERQSALRFSTKTRGSQRSAAGLFLYSGSALPLLLELSHPFQQHPPPSSANACIAGCQCDNIPRFPS